MVEYQARALTAAQLRAFYRVHLRWLFVGCGIGSTSLLIPREHWALHALWWLTVLVGGGIAFPRILLLNGIAEELRRRTPEHSGDATPTRPSPPSDQPAD